MDQTKYVAEAQEDFCTGNLLLKVRAPREKGAQTRMLDFGWGKFRPSSEGAPIPFIIIPAEAQEEVINELIRVLLERKNILMERHPKKPLTKQERLDAVISEFDFGPYPANFPNETKELLKKCMKVLAEDQGENYDQTGKD